jgi:trehalose 6-phosphate synthase complex regulatory subunit
MNLPLAPPEPLHQQRNITPRSHCPFSHPSQRVRNLNVGRNLAATQDDDVYRFAVSPSTHFAIKRLTSALARFHPYTVNFDVPQPEVDLANRPLSRPLTACANGQEISLLNRAYGQVTPPLTRRSTQQEELFLLKDINHSRDSIPSLKILNGMTPSEPLSPGWGRTFNWNQPSSRAKSPPPASVLQHGKGRGRSTSHVKRTVQKQRACEQLMAISRDRKFSQADWTIVQADLGNGGLINAVKAATNQGTLKDKLWVGTLGMPTDALEDHIKSGISEKLEDDHETLTVFVDDKDFDGHYSHYCKTMLWPVFHYQIPDSPKSKAYEDHSWKYYVKVNEAFTNRIAKNYKRGDTVWINDYHLLLVPSMLRKLLPEAKIGFYLHIAFPSSEVFRCLATRKELLEGVLGANLIGFQTDEYCHHFLQTCSRLLGVEAMKHGVQLEHRFVNVDTFPIGIDPDALDKSRDNPEVADWINIITGKYHDKKIIVARDKLDHIRGVRPKLLAYELFLKKYPQWKEKVVFIQVATSNTEQGELDAAVADVVTRINSHPSSVADVLLVFLKQDIPHHQYLALLTAADCLMITSLREGMNLTSHEYVYCQDGKHGNSKHGPLILSEFTGSASIFDGNKSLLVNPWDHQECAAAINEALEMGDQEKKRRWHELHTAVMHYTGGRWFKSFIRQLDRVWDEQSRRDCASIPRLSYDVLRQKYDNSQRRLFILDYEGTIASWGAPSSIIQSTPRRSLGALNDLIDDPRNTVYVMSGLMPEEMERLFRQVPGLGLIAENGCYVLEASRTSDFQDLTWTTLIDEAKVKVWKESMRAVLQYYQERIEGSKVEERHCSFILDYHHAADVPAVRQQVAECADHINGLCQDQHVHAFTPDGHLVVEHDRVNKSSAAAMIVNTMRRMQEGKDGAATFPDFLFVAGDSREDEHVFRWANKLGSRKAVKQVFTVSLGHGKNTEAMATLTGVTGVLSILQRLAAGK